ncbi:hypothetical protein QBC46DRAFT_411975 [Diplogelasinospora grovesii]|uniref:Uncharacterized protein n=1 Tax=Diplogelasinospora grovesii TaxID=303347 RepID=A0AAN6MZW5_9PEZI|nr:hypothetical protein QBC46DRAFT_411975 [Diplogelasinospora grovesii]
MSPNLVCHERPARHKCAIESWCAMRLRGEIERPLAVQTSTDLKAVQMWGNGDPEVRAVGRSATKTASLLYCRPGFNNIGMMYVVLPCVDLGSDCFLQDMQCGDDINEPWQFQDDKFDFIHIRAMTGSVPDWVEFQDNSARFRHPKPGGFVEQVELSGQAMSDDGTLAQDSALVMGEKTGKTFAASD